MDRRQLLDRLKGLMNLDYDAIKGYDRSIDDIDNADIREQLLLFRGDHERHVQDYRQMIEGMSGQVEEPHRDLKGAFLEAMAAIQSEFGQRSALKACESAEKVVNAKYQDVLSGELPSDVRNLVERNYADERRHLRYIRQALQKEAAA